MEMRDSKAELGELILKKEALERKIAKLNEQLDLVKSDKEVIERQIESCKAHIIEESKEQF